MEWEWEVEPGGRWQAFPEASSRSLDLACASSNPFELVPDPRQGSEEEEVSEDDSGSCDENVPVAFEAIDGVQVNRGTETARPIRRSAPDNAEASVGNTGTWECAVGLGIWVPYARLVSSAFDEAIEANQEGVGLQLNMQKVTSLEDSTASHKVFFSDAHGFILDTEELSMVRVRRTTRILPAPVREAPTAAEAPGEEATLSDGVTRLKDIIEIVDDLAEETDCSICLDSLKENPDPSESIARLSKCRHVFHNACLGLALRSRSACPLCNMVYGTMTGNMPKGSMVVKHYGAGDIPIDGYDSSSIGTIVIHYHFPSGVQDSRHPSPGHFYSGTARVAYLPDTHEGREVLRLLELAFERKLTFTVGTSVTTGQDNTVVWNGIHHKTNTQGGSSLFGYPDPGYFARVKAELAAVGVE